MSEIPSQKCPLFYCALRGSLGLCVAVCPRGGHSMHQHHNIHTCAAGIDLLFFISYPFLPLGLCRPRSSSWPHSVDGHFQNPKSQTPQSFFASLRFSAVWRLLWPAPTTRHALRLSTELSAERMREKIKDETREPFVEVSKDNSVKDLLANLDLSQGLCFYSFTLFFTSISQNSFVLFDPLLESLLSFNHLRPSS